jgi:hypothetical protein
MDEQTRQNLVDRYKDGYRVVREAVGEATDAELDARPAPGKWTAREIVHHLADSEMTSAIRLRMLIAQDRPTIVGYDEEVFARTLYYNRPIQASLSALEAARRSTAEILDRLTPDQWRREGTHTESGPYSVERWLEIYADHAHNHAEQILRAKASAKT